MPVYDLTSLTEQQLDRLHHNVWKRMIEGDGYQPWGYDWPTLRAAKPGWVPILEAIGAETQRRTAEKFPLLIQVAKRRA